MTGYMGLKSVHKWQNKVVVGSLEVCNLPDFNIHNLNVRVDTGAATSSLHVDNLEEFERDGQQWVRFDIHPNVHNVDQIVTCEAKLKSKRKVKSSNATKEKRCVIRTYIQMAGKKWKIELTLTDRTGMTYLMLLGRQAMAGRLVVDPDKEFLLGAVTG